MDEIRLGTIGSGVIVHSILDNLSAVEGIRLVSVYSRSREKAQALAGEYGAEKVYTDMADFISDEEMNFVYIATPNLLHYPQAKQALLAGKNVILEKPFVTRGYQAQELCDIAREKGLFIIDATPTFFLPNLELIRRNLPLIGRVRLVMANYSQYSSRYNNLLAGEVPNIFNPEYAGGCLMDINYYNLYLNIALFGKPQKAVYYPNIFGELTDTSGILILKYGDFVSESSGAKDTKGVNYFQIEGEKGYIYVEDGSNGLARVRVVADGRDEVWSDQENPDRYFYEVKNLTQMVLAGDKAMNDKGLEIMRDVAEVLESSRREAGIIFPGD